MLKRSLLLSDAVGLLAACAMRLDHTPSSKARARMMSDPHNYPPNPFESRQVRRARERGARKNCPAHL